jgi:hypothetical protein
LKLAAACGALIEQIDLRGAATMNLRDPRMAQTAMVFAAIFAALNAGMALARFDIGAATKATVISGAFSAIAIVLFLAAILWGIWKDGARRP